jgi:seryl-tRNA synthetase
MSDLRTELVEAGLLFPTGVDGVLGRSAMFETVLEQVNKAVSGWGREAKAEAVHFPPVMSRTQLERNGYLKSFPQLAAELHGCITPPPGSEPDAAVSQTGLMMVPAACYPIYPMLASRGALAADGALFDIYSWCFRHEPSIEPARLQSFRMHEYVRVGRPSDVAAFRESWMKMAAEIYQSLRLPHELIVSNDAFFGRSGRLMASSQRERNLKFELVVPVNNEREPTACCSFNYAEAHFTEAWDIRMSDGSHAHSACVGFGMERTTLALFRHHGLDPERWPADVRSVLFQS